MRRRVLICSVISLLVSAYGCGGGGNRVEEGLIAVPAVTQSMPETISGSGVFQARCSSCHLQGGNVINPKRPVRDAPELVDFQTFLSYIRNPRLPGGPRGAMPAFSPQSVSDVQAKELYQYVASSFKGQKSGEDRTAPALIGPADSNGVYCPYCGRFLRGFSTPR